LETLEGRYTPSGMGPDVDLSSRGAVGSVNGALFAQCDSQPTGTGVIDSFVRLQAQGAKATMQQGFNTDQRPLQFDENNSPQFTRSLRLDAVPVVDIGGVKYRQFLLDINQKASQPYLSLDELQLFTGNAGNLGSYCSATHQLAGLNAVYDLDVGGDHWVKLDARLNQGSGKGDMLLYVPESCFAGAGANAYVYLYSKFGVNFTPNAGFEEWAVAKSSLTTTQGSITGTIRDSNGVPLVDVVIFLDTNGDGILNNSEIYTVTDAYGHYSFDNLATGLGTYTTYHVREVVPDNSTLDTAPFWDVSLQNNGQVGVVDFVNKFNFDPPPPS